MEGRGQSLGEGPERWFPCPWPRCWTPKLGGRRAFDPGHTLINEGLKSLPDVPTPRPLGAPKARGRNSLPLALLPRPP